MNSDGVQLTFHTIFFAYKSSRSLTPGKDIAGLKSTGTRRQQLSFCVSHERHRSQLDWLIFLDRMASRAASRLTNLTRASRPLRSGSSRLRTHRTIVGHHGRRAYTGEATATSDARGSDTEHSTHTNMKDRTSVNRSTERCALTKCYPKSQLIGLITIHCNLTAYPTPRSQYHKLIESGVLRPDEHQEQIIDRLQSLHDQLESYEQAPILEANQSSSLVRAPWSTIPPRLNQYIPVYSTILEIRAPT